MHAARLGAVFGGGCAGGLARYAVVTHWPAHGFPWSTLWVNLSGAFLLSVILVVAFELLPPSTYVRPLLGTGFCGAWTTFSAVAVSTDQLAGDGHIAVGAAYLLASIGGGLLAGLGGMVVAREVTTRTRARRQP